MAYLSLGDYEAVARIREQISESLGSDTWHLINLDYNVKLAQWKMDELLDVLDRFSPEEMESYWLLQWKGFAELFRGELHKAHEYYLKGDPRWADPDQWSKLITQNRKDACMFAGLLLSIGEESQGRELLRQLRRHNEEILPALLPVLLEDSYRNQAVGLCYLAEGSYEKALDFYEQRIERGYIWESWRGGFGWRAVDKLPWWNPIREHPRYIAMATRIEEKQSEQRELLRSMDDAGITVP
jgi:tetratricopeptide (TPR) repeat protein